MDAEHGTSVSKPVDDKHYKRQIAELERLNAEVPLVPPSSALYNHQQLSLWLRADHSQVGEAGAGSRRLGIAQRESAE
jgi:hypothetical protein